MLDALSIQQHALALKIATLDRMDEEAMAYKAKVVLEFCSDETGAAEMAACSIASHLLQTRCG